MANRPELEKLLAPGAKPVTVYAGFDPTADSLHLGHLLIPLHAAAPFPEGRDTGPSRWRAARRG